MSSKSKNILIISYFANVNGCCMSGWTDDKLESLIGLGHNITLVYHDNGHAKSKYFSSEEDINLSNCYHLNRISKFFVILKSLIINLFLSGIFKFYTQKRSGGVWVWTVYALNISNKLIKNNNNYDLCLTFGGPASAHLAGILVKFIHPKIPLIMEFQDPLVAEGMGRNKFSKFGLNILEKLSFKFANKIIYVTQTAATEASLRNNKFCECIYPSAPLIPLRADILKLKKSSKFTMVHVGTLYDTRQLTDILSILNVVNKHDFIWEIINIGSIMGTHAAVYHESSFIRIIDPMDRDAALTLASQADLLLMVQHKDPISLTTIPFKFWDYLNLDKPILGLLNNPELYQLMVKYGHHPYSYNDLTNLRDYLVNFNPHNNLNSESKILSSLEQTKSLINI